ncbi:Uncharacterized conserved protein [Anoxybacillus flavithermus WK1]|uniref:Uncharacterized conserved protein n=1 Tax=Anoxybacillus flavithermus (strain DSM 21510 / WK1) TaxID=491915 RepID=B7GFS8_ANOFW|nr:Uncharacterized conserved protein [Anoxybacillus flavithermus WK1]
MQATGNALEAEAEIPDTLGIYGNQIQAIGNVTVVAGLLNKDGSQQEITGNWLQSLGGLLSFADDWGSEQSSPLSPRRMGVDKTVRRWGQMAIGAVFFRACFQLLNAVLELFIFFAQLFVFCQQLLNDLLLVSNELFLLLDFAD